MNLKNNNQHLVGVVLLLCVMSIGTPVLGAEYNFDRGQALYENHCQECHASDVHTRDNRLASSHDKLQAWVASWSAHAGLGWGLEEKDDVTHFLNLRFYRFTDSN